MFKNGTSTRKKLPKQLDQKHRDTPRDLTAGRRR
jgi:hypothetical protein